MDSSTVDLVDDEQTNELRVRPIPRFACDDVPLLRGRDDDLRVVDLRAAQGHVPGELSDVDAVGFEPRAQVTDHLRDERLHRRDVHDLKRAQIEAPVLPAVQGELVEYRQHRDVRLPRARGRAEEKVLRREHRGLVHLALHAVQGLHAFKRRVRPGRNLFDRPQRLVVRERFRLERGNVHLLVPFLRAAVRPGRELAPFVRHQTAPRGEREGVELEHLPARGGGAVPGVRDVRGDLASETSRFLANLALHLRLARSRARALPREPHRVENRRRLRTRGHLLHDRVLLVLVLRARESLEHEHEAVLARAFVILLIRERGQDVVRELSRLARLRVRVSKRVRDLALQPVRVDLGRFHEVVIDVVRAEIDVDASDAGASRGLDAAAFAVLVLVVDVARFEDFVELVGRVLVFFFLELDGDADVVVERVSGGAAVAAAVAAAAARGEIRHQLPERDVLRERLRVRRTHERLDFGLPLRVRASLLFQDLEDLLRGASQDVLRLISERALDHAQERLVRGPRLARLRSVRSVRVRGEDGRADRGLLALRGVRVEIVLIHSPLALIPRALFRFFHAILELRGFAPVHAVAESAGLDLTP
eukprot:30392-Pelagococcus_subviridis.AAC.5